MVIWVTLPPVTTKEMMGVFHAQSHEELDRFTAPGGENPMAVALREVSIEHPETLWRSIKDCFLKICIWRVPLPVTVGKEVSLGEKSY